MSEDTEFREGVREVIRRNDPSAKELRALAGDLETLAKRYETQEEVI